MLTAAATALWLGILTSISPCPLATNIAAVSFIARGAHRPALALAAGLAYTLGRAVTYLALGALVVSGIFAIPPLANFLGRYMNQLLGPILIITGMVLLDLLPVSLPAGIDAQKLKRLGGGGILGSALLGVIFALSLCPVSAALFFGSLIPIAVKEGSRVLAPAIYGVGTGLPVVAFAAIIAFAAGGIGKWFDRLTRIEKWMRVSTGVVFVVVGVYFCLIYVFLV
jgi:cytochrome c-type biogenesis protein